MERDISPEERLLRLIRRKPKKQEDVRAEKSESKAKPKTKTVEKKPAEEPQTNVTAPSFSNTSAIKDIANVDSITLTNKILAGIFVVLIVFFIIDYFFIQTVRLPDSVIASKYKLDESFKAKPVTYSFSHFEKDVSGKNIFEPIIQEEVYDEDEDEIDIDEILSGYSLLGIVSGVTPQAIIQDNSQKKSFFVNEGERIGDVRLKKILEAEGRVIMMYNDKEFGLGM